MPGAGNGADGRDLIGKEPDPLKKARLLAGTGDYPAAIKICGELAAAGKADIQTLLFEAETYNQMNEHGKALAKCRAVLKESPDNPWALRTLADTLSRQKKYDEAKTYFNKAIKADTSKEKIDSACAYFGLGMIDKERGNMKSARTNIAAAVKLMPGNEYFKDNLQQLK